ncbi:MAG: hypothetical protein J6W22_00430 [Fibrobacter sp.]|nr:hypothetical protein [Fibrobacter sp.]
MTSGSGTQAGCPEVQFVEVWSDSVSLQFLGQSNNALSAVTIKNGDGYSVSVNFGNVLVDSLGQRIWHGYMLTQDTVERRGELRVECNGELLAYFAYGWKPTGASAAVAKNLWESTDAFVKADFDMGFNQGLAAGQRLALQRDSTGLYMDARRTGNWKFYRAWEEPGENPIPVVWSPALMRYDENDIDSLSLEWSPVEDVNRYHLIILRGSLLGDSVIFVDTTVSMFTTRTSLKIPALPPGSYVWLVEPLVEVPMSENEEGTVYYIITGNDATSGMGGENGLPVMHFFPKKWKNWAKTSFTRVVEFNLPSVAAACDVVSGNMTWDKAESYLKDQVNPFGVIQVFVHTDSLHGRLNAVPKNMSELSKSYNKDYVYTAVPKDLDVYFLDPCFGPNVFCAMKDTRMLAENWTVGFDSASWNKIFPKLDKNNIINYAVHNRCWLTMAQMINHYYGGNLSSDEILYNVRGGFHDTSSSNPIESMQAVNYALDLDLFDQAAYILLVDTFRSRGILPVAGDWTATFPTMHFLANTSVEGWSLGTPNLHAIISTIESGNVMGVSQLNGGADGGHAMVLDGYRINSDGNVLIHLLNTDNMGKSEWRYYCNLSFLGMDIIAQFIANGIGQLIDFVRNLCEKEKGKNLSGDMFFSYYIPPLVAHGRNSNTSIFEDNDNDGVVDFDERERFGTDPNNRDTDMDGINDYQEIYDYKMCETYSGVYMPYVFTTTDSNNQPVIHTISEAQLSYIIQSDFDGDSLHAAIDNDSDGDGYCDLQEEAYLKDNPVHNCERFDASRHPDGELPKCWDYSLALLAKERLMLNDMVSCVSLDNTYCPVASYGEDFDWPYGVSLGVGAKAGNIYSTKAVFLRDNAQVHGNLETAGSVIEQSPTTTVTGAIVENVSHLKDFSDLFYRPALENVSATVDFSTYRQRIVNSGESVLSNVFGAGANSVAFNFNSGSVLNINTTGNFVASSLTFQRDAMLYPPAAGSVVFHVGNDFQWNGTVMTSDMISAAQHIMVYYYGTNTVFIQTDFAGTIIAPNAEVVVGQAGKNFYGSIFAKSIVVHQYTTVTWVPFIPAQVNGVVAKRGGLRVLDYSVNFLGV